MKNELFARLDSAKIQMTLKSPDRNKHKRNTGGQKPTRLHSYTHNKRILYQKSNDWRNHRTHKKDINKETCKKQSVEETNVCNKNISKTSTPNKPPPKKTSPKKTTPPKKPPQETTSKAALSRLPSTDLRRSAAPLLRR